ncbi:50S ribosomal protein L29 [Candidatus Gracilibacteria bacterium]|nr:50S ribosomal protein L29 [Candidatus Gracilibacteria bacterium]
MKEIKDLKLQAIDKLSEMDEKALRKELKDSGKKQFSLKMKLKLGELKQTHLITALRKYIAKIKTVANQKKFNVQ